MLRLPSCLPVRVEAPAGNGGGYRATVGPEIAPQSRLPSLQRLNGRAMFITEIGRIAGNIMALSGVLLMLANAECLALCALGTRLQMSETTHPQTSHCPNGRQSESSHLLSCLHSHLFIPIRVQMSEQPAASDRRSQTLLFAQFHQRRLASCSHVEDRPPPKSLFLPSAALRI